MLHAWNRCKILPFSACITVYTTLLISANSQITIENNCQLHNYFNYSFRHLLQENLDPPSCFWLSF